ncbi:putative ABC-type transport system, periplasmic component/surface lipoprotein [Desulfocapsa sulfexigens DSM 10523]|uniref:Putative ABC-type transport system, periplasmic component/surface lipoprotein n=1 Tax=Desulfocapsa sulfexigens (strain DSM 10523 / SB164P1) TaxID=1167006 RepID=M1PUI9_DESSD|nr:BMP family ABC transporter substrate-binding protein [Desulfocapsa sulfexigens]AGF79981.1 putative ABC-type transport system, periplasmic component/surface lipoprotein [Desulfocapsa sulfexigens DSM 10523]
MRKTVTSMALALIMSLLFLFSPQQGTASDEFIFGLLMVGPSNDHGWSQAHFEAGKEIEKHIPGSRMIYIDKVNPADRPGVTVPFLVDDLVSKGARLIIGNSDDMTDGIREAAMLHPDVKFIHISGDDALNPKSPENLSNLMGKMEYGQMIAGFAAAMTTTTGKIGYLGPLINDETKRLAAACFLGARYAWTSVLKKDPADLSFKVSWIGFWFNIPGVTSDPTQVAKNFFDSGADVVISGIDTTEALIVADQKKKEGAAVAAIPYDFQGSCNAAPNACLGVPYFNWVPGYTHFISKAIADSWKKEWLWLGPEWTDMNNSMTSSIGFQIGKALSGEIQAQLATFVKGLGDGSISLFSGPLNFQDKSVFLKKGEIATDMQIWNLPQLLEGMEGASQ